MRIQPVQRWPHVAAAALLLAAWCVQAQQYPSAPNAPAIRVGVDLVRVPARVVGETGGPIRNLKTADFRVFENGAEQRVAIFGEDRDPVYVALVVDTSASTEQHLSFLVTAAEKFAARFGAEDRLAVYEAGPEVVRLQAFTQDRAALDRAMRNLATARGFESLAAKQLSGSALLKRNNGRGGTLLYDAMLLARQDFPVTAERRILIVFTDGWDAGSDALFGAVQSAFLSGSEQLFAVIVRTPGVALSAMHTAAPLDKRRAKARSKDWSVVFDLSARDHRLADYERAGEAFLREMSAENRASLFTFDTRFLPVLAPPAEGRARRISNHLMPGPEALGVLNDIRKPRTEREKLGARNSKALGENILVLTAGDTADPRDLLRRLPHGRRPVVLNVDDLKNADTTRKLMQTMLLGVEGMRRAMAEAAFAQSLRIEMQLPQLALDTGGSAFAVEKSEDLDATYQNIAHQIRASYALGYYTAPEPGRREILVTVANPGLRVHARRVAFVGEPARPE